MVELPAALAGWGVVYAVLLAALAGLAVAPAVLDRTGRVRRPTAAERTALAAAGADPEGGADVRVLATDVPVAFAAGLLPRVGLVVVSRGLLAALPPDEAAAVVSHERGHLRRGHVPLRVGTPAAFVVVWTVAAAVGVPGAFVAGLALVVPVALASFAVSRWTEFDADRYAAGRGAGPALARALRRLYGSASRDDGGGGGGGGRLAALWSRHPPVAARLARLDAAGGTGGTGGTGESTGPGRRADDADPRAGGRR